MLTEKLNRPFSWRLPNKLLPVLANGLMLVLLSYLFSQLGTHILNIMHADEVPEFTVDTGNIPKHFTVTSGNVSRKIASMHLFGNIKEKEKQVQKKQIVAPETKLNLTLRGIIAEDHKHQGLAIIQQDNKNDEKPFAVKDTVFGLARLEEIYEDRVILLRNGKFETLRLPENALPREHFLNSDEVKAARKRVATNYRDKFLTGDGMELIKLFGFEAAHGSNGFRGFAIKAIGDQGREMMETLGVMEGDLITVVNGKRLSESLEAVASLKDLKTATTIDVIVERDGSEIPFNFELDPPPAELVNPIEPEEGTPEYLEELGEDWGETEEQQQQIDELRAKTPKKSHVPNEFDH